MTTVKLAARNNAGIAVAAGAATFTIATAVAASHKIATAGGRDQKNYHYPTIEHFRDTFPAIDVANVRTATSPLYHLVVAALSVPLGGSLFVSQIIGSLFAAALAALLVHTVGPRPLILAPLLLSAYFWQSTLWLNTDVAALLWVALALLALLRADTVRAFAAVGAFAALAVATRQTSIWVLIPIVAVIVGSGWRGREMVSRAVVSCVPALMVLALLVSAWEGLTPPAFVDVNANVRSWVSLSFGFAVLAIFAVPLVAATHRTLPVSSLRLPLTVGVLVTAPSVVFPSAPNVSSRTGGLVWSVAAHTPQIAGRSIFLMVAAFVGGVAGCLVLQRLDRRAGLILGFGYVGMCLTFTAAGDLFQRYFELPAALMFVIAAWILWGGLLRRWPLALLLVMQTVLLLGIVVVPMLR